MLKKMLYSIIPLLVLSLILFYVQEITDKSTQPRPVQGVLDLRGEDISQRGVIKLDGEWEFYWHRLVSYKDLSSEANADTYIKVPDYWQGNQIRGEALPGTGYATYRLKVKTGQAGERLALKMQPFSSAYRVYINDQVVAENGQVGVSENSTVDRYKPAVVIFDAPAQEFDIIVQAANFSFPQGGFWYPMHLGTVRQILAMQLHNSEKEMLMFGGILTVMICNLFVFLLRRKEVSYLYVVLFCGNILIYMMMSGEYYLIQLFPEMPFPVAMFLVYNVYYWIIVFFTGFMKQMFPQEVSGHIYWAIFIMASILSVLTLFIPEQVYAYVIPVYDFMIVVGFVYTLYRLILAVRDRRQSAGIMMAATAGIFFTGLNDMLYNRAYETPFGELLSIGAFILVLCQSFVMARRYSQSFHQIQELSTQLFSLDKFNDEFLISTAHELKTPLHGVMNLTKIVTDKEDNSLSEDGRKNLENISRITKKLSGLIDDIVDLYQIRENRSTLNIRSLDCRGTIQHVMDNLKILAHEKNLAMFNNLAIGQFYVLADEKRLEQIVHTLIDNAIRYTDQGRITVDAYKSEGKVHLAFTDTGIGIAEKRRKSLSVNTLGEHVKDERPEAGLGLAFYVASWIVRYMEGDLKIKWTEVGKGSCMELILPAGEVPAGLLQEDGCAQAAVTGDDGESFVKGGLEDLKGDQNTILIVDDEPTDLLVLKAYFPKENYRIMTARTGEQALKLLETHREISMILLDVMLPDSTGYAVCRKIREKFTLYELPVILLTIRNTPEEIHACMSAGANDFMIKPFVNSELNARVQTHLELKETLKRAVEMEVMFLQSQIKPHFIYNAISVITGLCFVDGQRAGDLMIQFGNYLRRTFDIDYRKNEVRLEEEISLICSYIEIEKARFGDRIMIEFDLDQEAMKCRIPSLILQPLVENGIRHGILKHIQGGTVYIRAARNGEDLELRVEDDGIGMSPEKIRQLLDPEADETGVALKNINRRMLSYFNRELEIKSELNKGTTILLRIPFKY